MPPATSLISLPAASPKAVVDGATTELAAGVLPVTPPPVLGLPETPSLTTGFPTGEPPALDFATGQLPADVPAPLLPVVTPTSPPDSTRASGAEPPTLPLIVNLPATTAPAAGPLAAQPPFVGPPMALPQPAFGPLHMPADPPVMPLSDSSTNALASEANRDADKGELKRGRKRNADPSTGSERATKISRGENHQEPCRRSSRKKENTKLNQQPARRAAQKRIIRSGPGWYEEEIWYAHLTQI
ncbi:hypothetical protein C8J57DRAFT_1384239 [Mycena rebaudengoi]|nr:hypothetical protein C8J57DRAFT_1384239 [Mycena rebaudengoi]